MRRSSALFLLLAACADFSVDSQRYHCAQDADCGAGWRCVSGVCGGSSADGGATAAVRASSSCPAVPACGGAVSGAWTYTEVCVDAAKPFINVGLDCTGLEFSNVRGVVTDGSLVFSGKGVTHARHLRVQADLKVPSACTLGTCDDYANSRFDGGALAATCVPLDQFHPTDCTCALTFDKTLSANGTVDTSAGTLTTTDGSLDVSTFRYCVFGGEMVMKQETGPQVLNAVGTLSQ